MIAWYLVGLDECVCDAYVPIANHIHFCMNTWYQRLDKPILAAAEETVWLLFFTETYLLRMLLLKLNHVHVVRRHSRTFLRPSTTFVCQYSTLEDKVVLILLYGGAGMCTMSIAAISFFTSDMSSYLDLAVFIQMNVIQPPWPSAQGYKVAVTLSTHCNTTISDAPIHRYILTHLSL